MSSSFIAKSGQRNTIRTYCPTLGFDCPIGIAVAKHKSYVDALQELHDINNYQGTRLRMAEFVNEIARRAPQAGEGKLTEADVWGALRVGEDIYVDRCKSFDHTYLKQDIEKQRATVREAGERVEAAAEDLVRYITSKEFQHHLVDTHSTMLISEEDAEKYYELPPGVHIRQLEHVAALLTEYLSLSRAGKTLLADLLDSTKLSQLPAFAGVWDSINALKESHTGEEQPLGLSLSAIGKLFYNVSPVITEPPNGFKPGEDILAYYKKRKTLTGMLSQPQVKKAFNFLDEKFGEKISGAIESHLGRLAAESDLTMADMREGRSLRFSVARSGRSFEWSSSDSGISDEIKQADQLRQLENAWFSLAISAISFSLSMTKLIAHLEESDFKDYVNVLGELSALMESAATTASSNICLQGGNVHAAKGFARTLGVTGAILGAVVYAWDVSTSIQRRDLEEICLNMVGLGIGIGSIYACIIGASFALSILGVAGIVLGLIMAVMADHPLITYLEDTAWGRNRNRVIAPEESISEFVKRMYRFRVTFIGYRNQKELAYVEVRSTAMSDTTAIRLGCRGDGSALPPQKAVPSENSIEGKGEIVKVAGSWLEDKALLPRSIRIYRLYEVWPRLLDSPGKRFKLVAGIDKDGTGGSIEQLVLNDGTHVWFD